MASALVRLGLQSRKLDRRARQGSSGFRELLLG